MMRFLYLRYLNWVFRSQQFAAFPETVEGRNDGAGYDTIEDLKKKAERVRQEAPRPGLHLSAVRLKTYGE